MTFFAERVRNKSKEKNPGSSWDSNPRPCVLKSRLHSKLKSAIQVQSIIISCPSTPEVGLVRISLTFRREGMVECSGTVDMVLISTGE